MPTPNISPYDPYPRRRVNAAGLTMAYLDTAPAATDAAAAADAAVSLHGNPTFSYLWRNVIPYLEPLTRCLAPDLPGMGESGPTPNGSYRFADHRHHLDAWFDAVIPAGRVTLIMHDWGSALGFHWAYRHPERIKGLAYLEALVRPLTGSEWPAAARRIFQGLRSPAGEEMVLTNNVFIERILPGSVLRPLHPAALAVYRRPFAEPGESRRPTLTWPREIPMDGSPADVTALVQEYAQWLACSPLPKLFLNAEPGAILTGAQREFCRTWPNQQEVTVPGLHFLPEESPAAIGQALAQWYAAL